MKRKIRDKEWKTHSAWKIVLPSNFNGIHVWDICWLHGIAATNWSKEEKYLYQIRLFETIDVGDWIVAYLRNKDIGGVGKVTSTFNESLVANTPIAEDFFSGYFWYRIGVEWIRVNMSIDVLPKHAQNPFRTPLTLLRIEKDILEIIFSTLDSNDQDRINNKLS